ncbi:MAG: hypothetical protein O7C03_07890, partial [Gammaproteobacteria bacterium]|nr:hypothetical protein [Gammaproteobacteria bacterium]
MQEIESGAAGETAQTQLFDAEILAWVPDALRPVLHVLADYPMLLIVILVSIGYAVGKLLQLVLARGLTRLTRKTRSDLDDRLVELARRPVLMTP